MQPASVDEAAQRLIGLFESAQTDIEQQLSTFTDGRRAARLRELQRTVTTSLDGLRTSASDWLQTELPSIYELGGETAAELLGDSFVWTLPHTAAVQVLAERSFNDLLDATSFVARDTKAWIRDEARQQLTLSLLEGRTASQAAAAFADAAGSEIGLFAVRYKDGSLHRLDDYADSAIRAVSAETYNVGTINQSRAMGVEFAEVADGAECGLASHDDNEKPNGRIYRLDVIEQYPIAHPRCRRSILPRIDATSTDAESLRPDPQRADQAASEVANSNRRPRQSRSSGNARTPRTPRAGTPEPTAAPAAKAPSSMVGFPAHGLRSDQNTTIDDATATLQQIDTLHTLPDGLRSVEFRTTVNLGAEGHFASDRLTGEPVEIAIDARAMNTASTMAHEFGHYLDHEAIAAAGDFATENSPLMDEWRAAVDNSNAVAELKRISAAATDARIVDHIDDYMLTPYELWARSYSQWVATRLDDKDMLAHVATMAGNHIPYQWATSDFEPIGKAIDALFRSLGWMT